MFKLDSKYLFLTLSTISAFSCSNKETQKEVKPNIILILTDDQGYGDIGCHGNPDIITPNLNKLAYESLRFNQFYVSPTSAPTRASLLTGRYALRTGIYEVQNGGCLMDGKEFTIAEMLKKSNYKTAIFGKWHLGDNYPLRPEDQGFDEVFTHIAGGIGQPGDHWDNYHNETIPFDKRKHSYFDPVIYHNGKYEKTTGYCTDVFTNKAIEYIEKQINNPFFIYLAYNAPHDPYQVPKKYLEMYNNLNIKPKNYGDNGQPFPKMDSTKIRGDFNDYDNTKRLYAMITNIDDNLGRIREKLKELSLDKNTLIIFLSDNGPQWGRRYNAGLKGSKGSILEGGTRVPCFMYYPDNNWLNSDINEPTAHIDLLPTIADLCNINLPVNSQIDGVSLVNLIKKNKPDERYIFNEFSSGFPTEKDKCFNISARKGDYKYLAYDRGGQAHEHQLYNIAKDPKELNNIAKDHPDILAEFKLATEQWFDKTVEELKNKEIYTIIGSDFQDTVILNRSEWKGENGRSDKWDYTYAEGYWDIEFAKKGDYKLILKQRLPWPSKGVVSIKLNDKTLQPDFTYLNKNEIAVTLKNIEKGRYSFSAKFQTIIKDEFVSPDYVFVFKESN